MIVKGDTIEEIMSVYDMSFDEAAHATQEVNNALRDEKVSEEEFQNYCDELDQVWEDYKK